MSSAQLATAAPDATSTRTGGVGRPLIVDAGPTIAVLVTVFLLRLALADWNSYWLDELLSVEVYGRWHDTALEAIRYLGEHSVHPPLYQWLLFHWMEVFGSTEVATRALSNLHVTLAALLLYLIVRTVAPRAVASTAAIAFALMRTPMHFALETRSYAQTLMLATLSSYLLLVLLLARAPRRPRELLVSPPALGLVAANLALLMTHYYNAFFLAAQAVFVGVFLLVDGRRTGRTAARLGYAALAYVVPLALFAGLWGEVLVHHLDRHGASHQLDGAPRTPWSLLNDSVIAPNLVAAGAVVALAVVGAVLIVARGLRTRRGTDDPPGIEERRAWTVAYCACWLVLPLAIAAVAFAVLGVERYNDRYFVYSVVPIAPLIVITLVDGGRTLLRRAGGARAPSPAVAGSLLALVVFALVVPGTYDAATHRRHDWRGLVAQVTDVIERDVGTSHIVYEASLRAEPLTDHYFARMSDEIRAAGTLRRAEEAAGEYRLLDDDRDEVAAHDRLVVLFPHPRVTHYPVALERLAERYEVVYEQFNDLGHGYIIYEVPAQEQALAAGDAG